MLNEPSRSILFMPVGCRTLGQMSVPKEIFIASALKALPSNVTEDAGLINKGQSPMTQHYSL